MGVWPVTTSIKPINGFGTGFEAEFLVDNGAIDCMAPASKLEQAGIQRVDRDTYELADGTAFQLDYGYALVTFMGAATVAQIIFGPENSEPILGVVALENTGIMIDPRSRKLHRMHAKPLKAARCAQR